MEANNKHKFINTEDGKWLLATANTEDDATPAAGSIDVDTEDDARPVEEEEVLEREVAAKEATEVVSGRPQQRRQRQQVLVLMAAAMSSKAAMGGWFECGTIELHHVAGGDSIGGAGAGDSQSFDNTSRAGLGGRCYHYLLQIHIIMA